MTQKNGARWSAADAYLRPALRRGNLTVWTQVHVARLLTEEGRAAGVEFLFLGGESIRTEYSYKYTLDSLRDFAQAAGFKLERTWTDERRYFSVNLLVCS